MTRPTTQRRGDSRASKCPVGRPARDVVLRASELRTSGIAMLICRPYTGPSGLAPDIDALSHALAAGAGWQGYHSGRTQALRLRPRALKRQTDRANEAAGRLVRPATWRP